MTYDEMLERRAHIAADRMKAVVAAGRLTRAMMDDLGFRGSPGFMGRGTYPTAGRDAGYRRAS